MLSVKLLTLEFSCYICEQWLGEEGRPLVCRKKKEGAGKGRREKGEKRDRRGGKGGRREGGQTGHVLSVKLLTLEFSCYICEQWLGDEGRPLVCRKEEEGEGKGRRDKGEKRDRRGRKREEGGREAFKQATCSP
jgi:hypothetical protein